MFDEIFRGTHPIPYQEIYHIVVMVIDETLGQNTEALSVNYQFRLSGHQLLVHKSCSILESGALVILQLMVLCLLH